MDRRVTACRCVLSCEAAWHVLTRLLMFDHDGTVHPPLWFLQCMKAKEICRRAPCAHLWLPALFIERAKHLHLPHPAFSLSRARMLACSFSLALDLDFSLARSFSFSLARSLLVSLARSLSFSLSLSLLQTHTCWVRSQ